MANYAKLFEHCEWCIDDLRGGVDSLSERLHPLPRAVDAQDEALRTLLADHEQLLQSHQTLQQEHQQLQQSHQALQQDHTRLEQQVLERHKDWDGVMARLVSLEDERDNVQQQRSQTYHGTGMAGASSSASVHDHMALPTPGLPPTVADGPSRIPPDKWTVRCGLALQVDGQPLAACLHSWRASVLGNGPGLFLRGFVSAADTETDADKLWNQCQGLSASFDFDSHELYEILRYRPGIFMQYHNPATGSSGYDVVFGCDQCGRHTPDMQPQYGKCNPLPKDSEEAKCVFREIISCILTTDDEEFVLKAMPCTRRAPYAVPIPTRSPREVFPQVAIEL